MKVMRYISFLLSLLMLFTLMCGCGVQDATPSTTQSTTQPTTEPTPEPEYLDATFPTDGLMHYYFMTSSGLVMDPDAKAPEKWGDACLIILPNKETMLIDCGQTLMAPILVENIKRMGIEKIDHLIFSHRHGDHINGATTEGGIFDSFAVGQVYTSSVYNGKHDDPKVIESICQEKNIPLQLIYIGDQLSFGDVTMDVLWPEENMYDQYPTDTEELNNASLVLKFTWQSHTSLFAGDLYEAGEAALVNAYQDDPMVLRVQLLKAPHHGSRTSNSMKFLAAVQPKLGVATGYVTIASNIRSTYETCQATILTDKTSGYIHVVSDGTDITWETSK